MKRMWVCAFGEIRLPDDFPTSAFRNDGWWDMRFKRFDKWQAWIATEEAILQMGYMIPNRLHGVAINAEGDAI